MIRGPFAGVVLAAGAGTRLRPLTRLRPKALCPVGTVPLLDLALRRLVPLAGSGPHALAVNAHAFASAVAGHVRGRAHVSVEANEALGTAGALGRLRAWIDGRDAAVTNVDAYLPGGLAAFADAAGGWDGVRSRLLCAAVDGPGDFPAVRPGVRYVGACLLPWTAVARLGAVPSGLYEVLWRAQAGEGLLDLVLLEESGLSVAIDCGTPADYLAANLHASGGASVIDPSAVVEGMVERCVVWPRGFVGPHERLVEVIRAGTRTQPVTVPGTPSTLPGAIADSNRPNT
jgi:N-acetyl-alpha-D-muramate 1-phosphate uridylyltransferase